MAIGFRAASGATSSANSVVSLPVNKPTGVVAGDFMLAVICTNGTTGDSVAPSGWTVVSSVTDGSPVNRTTYAWKIAGGSEPTTYTFSWDVNGGAVIIAAYSGVDATTPFTYTLIPEPSASGVTAHTTGSLTTTNAGSWLVATYSDGSGSTWTGTMTEREERVRNAAVTVMLEDSNAPVATGSYTRTGTGSASANRATMGLLALNPGSSNSLPVITASNVSNIEPWTVVNLNASASDSDGTISSLNVVQLTGNNTPTISGTGGTRTYTHKPTTLGIETRTFRWTAVDNQGGTTTYDVTHTFLPATDAIRGASAWIPIRFIRKALSGASATYPSNYPEEY